MINPACYLPTSANNLIPSSFACPPPPTSYTGFFTNTYLTSVSNLFSPLTSTLTTVKTGTNAIMSLPLLSFLLIPTMTSYSTSLNLLFFYLTWSTLVLSHDALKVEIVASLAVRVLFYVLPCVVFLAFDVLVPGLSEGFKALGGRALPLRDLTRGRSYRYVRVLGWSLGNVVLSVGMQAVVELGLTVGLEWRSAIRITTTLPLPWAIVKDLIRGLVLRDVLTYGIHRYLLHSRANALARDLSHLHEQWYHAEIRAPFPFSSSYDHPIAYLLRCFVPTYGPAMFWRFHALTYIVYLFLISLEDTFTHSGYSHLPTHFVLGGIARRNDLHCLTDGKGNYGTLGLIDWLAGTSVGSDVAEDLVEEVQIINMEEKVRRGAKKVRRSLNVNGSEDGKRRATRTSRRTTNSGSSGADRTRRRSTRRRRVESDGEYED